MAFSFGDVDLSGMLACSSTARKVAPERRLTKTEVPGMDGCHVRDEGLSAMEISVGVIMLAKTADEVSETRRRLAAALQGGAKPLVLPDEPERFVWAQYMGGDDWDAAVSSPSAKLSFLCADPLSYGQERTASVGTSSTLIRPGGTYKALPLITANPSKGSYWTITNVTTGEFVRVDADFTGSQTVVIDMAAERCTLNGADCPVTLSSTFFALDGDCTVKCSSGAATMEWRERWL